METIKIDQTKLPAVMKIIEQAAEWMAEKDCGHDETAKLYLENLQQELRRITGNEKILIEAFAHYWSYTNLETVAKKALMSPPAKDHATDAQIREIVLNILNHEEAEMDWWLEYLTINTGLDRLTDYIFYPDSVGLDAQASLAQIADKILADRK